jgi:hypothetical protein
VRFSLERVPPQVHERHDISMPRFQIHSERPFRFPPWLTQRAVWLPPAPWGRSRRTRRLCP